MCAKYLFTTFSQPRVNEQGISRRSIEETSVERVAET